MTELPSSYRTLEEVEAEARRNMVTQTTSELLALEFDVARLFHKLSQVLYRWNAFQGFWDGDPNVGEKIALMHSELSEALEAHRKSLQDDKLPQYAGLDVELADTLIRIFDFCGAHRIRIGEVMMVKLLYNLSRPYRHGKAY